MEIIRILIGSPIFLLASLAVFISALICGIKKGKISALKIHLVFFVIVVVKMAISATQLHIEMHSEKMGHGDSIFLPLASLLCASIYAFTLTFIGTLTLGIVKFNKKDLWIETMVMLISATSILASGSVIYLLIGMLKP
jgi:hypothetical protein